MKIALALLVLFAFIGCHSRGDNDPTPRRAPASVSVQRQANSLDDFVTDVQGAQTPQQEADAIRALRRHEIANGLTYKIATFRIGDDGVIADASTVSGPVRTQVTIYRGRDIVRTFNFVPKDNRNLALFGE